MEKRNGESISHQPSGAKEGLPAWGLSRSLRSWLGEGHTRRSPHSIEGEQSLRSPCRRVASRRNPELVHEHTVEGCVDDGLYRVLPLAPHRKSSLGVINSRKILANEPLISQH